MFKEFVLFCCVLKIMWFGLLLGAVGALAATQCPCTFTVDPVANSAITSYVYPVIECDQICGPPALAFQYYSFETPWGPCRCFGTSSDLIGYYYENSSASTSIYYQNGGSPSICDPCFPSPTPSPSMSPSVSPSGMCYVVHNLLYGKTYNDGYYTVVHGINASHAYNPTPILLGINPSCTESPGVCTCSYTQGSTFSCPYTRSATLRYQYGATTTMTFVNESPVCRYTFNMFINFNSVSPTPSTSSSFTPAGSPTVSKTQSVSVSPSVSSSMSSSGSLSSSITQSPSNSETPSIIAVQIINRLTPAVIVVQTASPVQTKSSDSTVGIVLGAISLAGIIALITFQVIRTRSATNILERIIQDDSDDEDFVETPVIQYIPSPELVHESISNNDEHLRKSTTLLELDTEDVGAVMMFLHTRMKTATVIGSHL